MTRKQSTQSKWAARAEVVLPAGGFGNFDGGLVIRDGQGARVRDEDGNEYVEYLIGSGPMILGHCHPEVTAAVKDQLARGTTYFANNAQGIALAEDICAAVACAEQLRFVSTGGEADMYAMRLARAHTGREKILKFEGGYHGMSSESLMSLAPTRLADFPGAVPDSAGIPESVRQSMLIAPFNDAHYVEELVEANAADIAAIIVEPLQRLIPPKPGFLQLLRQLSDRHGIVLIFDEIVTGFRFAYGGAQEYYGVVPDVCTLGKIIGGGFPLAAIAGRRSIMAHFDQSRAGTDGFLYQVGTLSGNPVAAVAGRKTLEVLRRAAAYEKLRETGERIMHKLGDSLTRAGIPHQVVGHPMLFDVVFTSDAVHDYRDFLAGDAAILNRFNSLLRQQGVLKPPSKFYPSLALTEDDLQLTEKAIDYVAGRLHSSGSTE